MTFLRARPEPMSDREVTRLRERLDAAAVAGDITVVLGYAVAHTIHGRTGLTHTTPLDYGEAAHELRQCRKRGGIYTLIELRHADGGE